MFIDSSYTLAEIRAREMTHVLSVRHLGNFWSQVVSAHPLDMRDADDDAEPRFGRTSVETINPNHRFVRGRFGRFKALSRISILNAVLALVNFTCTLIRLARKERIDAVRAGDPLLCGAIGLVVARLSGTGLVIRIPANNDLIRALTGRPTQARFTRTIAIEKWLERVVISRADAIIAPSENYAGFAVSRGARRDKIFLVRYGSMVDPAHQLPPAERPPVEDPTLVARLSERHWMIHIGRLSEIKRIEDCFDVLEILAPQGLDVGLLLVGDGPMRDALATRAANAGLSDRVLFLGNVSQPELIALLPYAAVVLSPLTGRALAEAAFSARPVVAYDLDWQGDLVRTNETGILVGESDTEAMAAGVRRFLEDQDFAERMGAAVRNRALEMLSPDVALENERAAYESVMDGGAS